MTTVAFSTRLLLFSLAKRNVYNKAFGFETVFLL